MGIHLQSIKRGHINQFHSSRSVLPPNEKLQGFNGHVTDYTPVDREVSDAYSPEARRKMPKL